MENQKGYDKPATLDDEVERFINMLERMYKEKPTGYFGYLATCGSAMKLADFTNSPPSLPPQQAQERKK